MTKRVTPHGVSVVCHEAAFDVKYASSVGQNAPLSMECGCRITLSLKIGQWTYNFIERNTCGMSKSGVSLEPHTPDYKVGMKKVMDYIGIDSDRIDEYFPNGVPSFDVLELVAQKQKQKQKKTREGGVLV